MKYLIILLVFIPSLVFCQDKQVELIETRTEEGIVLTGVNNLSDQPITLVVEISSVGFGLKKLETISKTIPANGEVEVIKLVATPNRQCSYSANFSYKTKQIQPAKVVKVKEKTKVPAKTNKQAKTKVNNQQSNATTKKKADSMIKEKGIVVYSKNGCGRCEYVTNYFELNEIPFKDLNITTSEKANSEMSEVLFANGFKGGSFTTPVITIDGEPFYNIKDLKSFVKDLKMKTDH